MVVPGEGLPTEESLPSEIVSTASASQTNPASAASAASSSPSRTTATVSSTSAAASNTSTASHHHLSSGAIAGIAVGGVAVAAGIGFLLYLLGQHRKEIQFLRRDVHVQSQNRRSAPPEMKHEYSSPGSPQPPLSPNYPYSAQDPRFQDHQGYDVPPYSNLAEPLQAPAVELPSPLLGTGIGRSGSPFSELNTRTNTLKAPQRNLRGDSGAGSGGASSGDSNST